MTTLTPPFVDRNLKANFRHLYGDVFWYGLLAGSALAFLPIYVARLGASGFQVGLLTAGPAVINLLISLPAGRWLEGRSQARTTFWMSLGHRAGFVALLPLTWLAPAAWQIWLVPALIMLMSFPGTVLAISFNAMFADTVPPEWRGQVIGQRNALLSVSMTGATLLCGWLLNTIVFPLNYQVVFGLGLVGAACSSYALSQIRPLASLPPRVHQPLLDAARPDGLRQGDATRPAQGLRFLTRLGKQAGLRADLLRGPFGPFLAAYFLFYAFQYIPIPVVPVFWVRELHLNEVDISIGNGLFYAIMMLASMRLGRLTQRWGNRRLLVAGALLYGLYPLLNSLAWDARLYWVSSVVGGAVWAVLNGGLVTRLMERVPVEELAPHMALHNLALNLGILSGSLLGPALGDAFGLRTALLAGAALRTLAGLLIWRWG